MDMHIVGGGSAGAVVANRLSKEFKVLLLDGGGTPSPVSEMPLCKLGLLGTQMDYDYETVPQKQAALAFVENVRCFQLKTNSAPFRI